MFHSFIESEIAIVQIRGHIIAQGQARANLNCSGRCDAFRGDFQPCVGKPRNVRGHHIFLRA